MSCVLHPSASKHAVSIGSPLWRNPAGHYIPGVTTSFDDVDVTEAFGKTANERQYTRMTARSVIEVRYWTTGDRSWILDLSPFSYPFSSFEEDVVGGPRSCREDGNTNLH